MSEVKREEKKIIFIGILTVVILLLVLVGWGVFTKVDTFVVAPGRVEVVNFKKAVQHDSWGAVVKVFVKEGENVERGQPLLELRRIEPETQLKEYRNIYYSLLGKRDRLISEEKGYSRVVFSKEFLSLEDEKLRRKIEEQEEKAFRKRKDRLLTELSVLEKQEQEVKENLTRLNKVLQEKEALRKMYISDISELEKLLHKGLITKDRVESLKRNLKSVEADIRDLQYQIPQVKARIQQIEEQKNAKVAAYRSEVADQLEDVNMRLSQIKPKLGYAKEKVKLTILRAPASGQVIGLKIHSPGEVVKPGETLMYIVPETRKVFVVAELMTKDRDRVKVGQFVDLRFSAFLSIAANVVEGKVSFVSNDVLETDMRGRKVSYYEIHVDITKKGWEQLRKYGFSLVPGMPAVAYIKVEKVRPVEYVIQPVILLLKGAFIAN